MFTDIQQETLDIDWFFVANDKIGFVASGGGKLPNSVAKLDLEIQTISTYFRSLPNKSNVVANDKLKDIKGTNLTEDYLSDFVNMAKKGLYTFDKTSLNNFSSLSYHLVASPTEPLRIDELPHEIRELIGQTRYKGALEYLDSFEVNQVD